jgi:3D (Asp-Asp-Asp) domain-containing protein
VKSSPDATPGVAPLTAPAPAPPGGPAAAATRAAAAGQSRAERRARLRARRRRAEALTFAARLVVLMLVIVAFAQRVNGPANRPGDLLRHPPAVVVAAAPAEVPIIAPPTPLRVRRPKLFRSLSERVADGERVAVEVTAYCLQGLTRRENYVRPGIVAADPKVFRLGRYIDLFIGRRYFGRFLVDDTGKDIKGNRLDLWTQSCRDARFFGRRMGTATLVERSDDVPRAPDVGPSLR